MVYSLKEKQKMIKCHAIKRSTNLLEQNPDIIRNFDNAYEIVSMTHKKYKKHIDFQRIIEFLILFDNLPDVFNYKTAIYYQDKLNERISRLRSEGKHQSVIDISLYEIFAKNENDAKIIYNKMVKKKTKKWTELKGSVKDSKSLDFHIRKYGKERGAEIYNEKKNNGYFKRTSNACIEYYLERNYTEEEAIELIKERQAVGKLERFIERYGMQEGIKRWEERQIKWQKSLSNRNPEDIKLTNKKRNPVIAYKARGFEKEKIAELLMADKRKFNYTLHHNLESFDIKIRDDIEKGLIYNYMHINDIISFYSETQFILLDIDDILGFMQNYIIVSEKYTEKETQNCGLYRNYTMKIDEGFLRSSFEILFYRLLKQRNINFNLDNKYPQDNNPGSLRYDFYLPDYDRYIEISPLYQSKKAVKESVDKKKKLFNCDILCTKEEISQYVKSLPDIF